MLGQARFLLSGDVFRDVMCFVLLRDVFRFCVCVSLLEELSFAKKNFLFSG